MALKQEKLTQPGYENVVYAEDADAGLRAIVAVHNTNLGPACGGIRLLPYPTRDEALEDVLRLSRGMSYKSSLAGIQFGGGKSVIIADPAKKTPALMQAFGRFVDTFGGGYICAKDMNITSDDLKEVAKVTKHVLGIDGVPGSSGDPSPVTAHGMFRALEATVESMTGSRSLKGIRVAFQGIGYVGYTYAKLARQAGATLLVTDTNPEAVQRATKELGAEAVALDAIYDVDADVFAPCARGAILNRDTIPRLKMKAICGAANNQLAEPQDGYRLYERGILYAPDYAVNSGGIINVFYERVPGGYDHAKAIRHADGIFDTMKEIFARSKKQGEPPFVVADQLAEERMANAKKKA